MMLDTATLKKTEGNEKAKPKPAPTPRHRAARILIADDEARIRLTVRACLEAEGYEVLEAADGLEAMDVIIHAAPDVMILDLAMPTMDGVRTVQQLQGVHGQLKPRIIILTAFGSAPAMLKTLGMGASLFLEKPVTPATLRDAVRRALEDLEENPTAGIPIDWSVVLREEHDEPEN
jgi:DNA-binding response OmpR family regulator